MVSVIWGGIAAIIGLLVILGESVIGLHQQGVSHANVVLWLVITPVAVVGSMVHHRLRVTEGYGYGAALRTGLITSATSTVGLFSIWILFIAVMFPDYFVLMHGFAEAQARAQGHTGVLLIQEVHVAKLIFAAPSFYVISAIIPLLVGTIASVIGAIGIRKR